jgi:hypothetical protein
MANFTATNSPVLDCLPGATIKLESAIAAATAADAGNIILLMLYAQRAWHMGPRSGSRSCGARQR